jgi:hypothetical protein
MTSSAFQQQCEAACQLHHSRLHPFTAAWMDGKMSREQLGCGQCSITIVFKKSNVPNCRTEVSGANDLGRYLANDRIDQRAFSFLKHLSIYACGRSLTYSELHQLKQDGLKLKADGYRMKNMSN